MSKVYEDTKDDPNDVSTLINFCDQFSRVLVESQPIQIYLVSESRRFSRVYGAPSID